MTSFTSMSATSMSMAARQRNNESMVAIHAKTSSVVGSAQETLRCGGYVASRVFRILKALQSDAAKGKEVERLLRQFPAWDPYKAFTIRRPCILKWCCKKSAT